MSRWDEPPASPVMDGNLAALVNSPSGELDWMDVRTVAEGSIATTETQIGTGTCGPDGAIYVEGCQNILIGIFACTFGTAASLQIYPKFAFNRGGTYLRNVFPLWDLTGDVYEHALITAQTIRIITTAQLFIANLRNPGCRWMKLFAIAATNPATSADIKVARGFVEPNIPLILDTA